MHLGSFLYSWRKLISRDFSRVSSYTSAGVVLDENCRTPPVVLPSPPVEFTSYLKMSLSDILTSIDATMLMASGWPPRRSNSGCRVR